MKLYVITGQTATGKTEKARQLAQKVNGEIINCDSRQIYCGLDIISGKDIEKDAAFHHVEILDGFSVGYYQSKKQSSMPVWLYDAARINQSCTAHDFRQLAQYVTAHIWRRDKTPILVGGTYFYLSAFLYDIDTYHVPPDPAMRQELEDKSVNELQRILAMHHPLWLEQMNESDRVNPRRLVRKIEIASRIECPPENESGRKSVPYSAFLKGVDIFWSAYKHSNIADLLEVIRKRVLLRLDQGAIDEYQSLKKIYPDTRMPGYSTIGCKEIEELLDGQITREELIDRWTTREVQYAKRQSTFMKKDLHAVWHLV